MRQFATDQFKGGNEGQCFGKKSNANFDSGFIDQSGGGGGTGLVNYAVNGNIDSSGITLYISASGTSRIQTEPNPDPQDWSSMKFYPAVNSGYAYAERNSATLAFSYLDEGKAIQVAENVYKVVSNDFDDNVPTLTIGFGNNKFTLLMESWELDSEQKQKQFVDFDHINMRISDIYLIDGKNQYIAFTIEDTMNRLISQTTYSQCYPTFEAINVSNNQHPHRVVVPANFTITTES